MPFTREERLIIEGLIKQANIANNRILELESSVRILNSMVGGLSGDNNILTSGEVQELINKALTSSKTILPKHDHTSDSQGGSAFAKLGASLIN